MDRQARAELAAPDGEARLEALVGHATDVVAVLDAEARIRYISPAVERVLGYFQQDRVGITPFPFLHPDDRPRVQQFHAQVLHAPGMALPFTTRIRHQDGSWHHLELTATNLLADPAVGGIVVNYRDVTAWKAAEAAARSSEERFQRLAAATFEAVVIHDTGTILEVNAAFAALFACDPAAVIGRSVLDFAAPESRALVRDRVLAQDEASYEAIGLRADGTRFVGELRGKPIPYRGRTVRVTAIRDISERKRMEEALRAGEARHRAVVDTAFDAIITASAAGAIASFNPGAERIFGYAAPEVLGQPITLLMPARYQADHTAGMQRYLAGAESRVQGRIVEVMGLRKDGTEVPLELTVAVTEWLDGRERLFVGILRDIAERKALERQLAHRAFHDPLTDLPNRALFMDRLQHTLEAGARNREVVAVLYLDLDRFKVINDDLGHEAGDQLLVAVAQRLRESVRPGDTVSRLGGDEFTILLATPIGLDEVVAVAERILAALGGPIAVAGYPVHITASIGIALSACGHDTAAALLHEADIAMYWAKRRSEAGYAVFDPSMRAERGEHPGPESELRRALERGELRVVYQPQVELMTGRVAGVEALVRWRHPRGGLLPPGVFIPLAEETGLIVPLGKWVLEEACWQARRWRDDQPGRPPPLMSVNLSPRQFRHPALAAEVARILETTGVDPRWLELEITESAIMEGTPSTLAALQQLKALGVRLAIDDFGVGHASFGSLKVLPLDTLKIDRSFIAGLGDDQREAAIVQAMITMAGQLGMRVVAEGVERAEQLERLRALGCPWGQGHFLAAPLTSTQVSKLLHRTRR